MGLYQMRSAFGHYMKALLFVIALIFIVGAVYQFGVAPNNANAPKAGGDAVIATVGEAQIAQKDFDPLWEAALENAKRTQEAEKSGPLSVLRLADVRAMLLQQLVQGQQVIQYATKLGIDVSEDAVTAEVDKLVLEQLKAGRRAILGKLSKAEEKVDPRKDGEYKKQLASVGNSIADQEARVRMQIPVGQIRSQLAIKGIQAYLKKNVGTVTEADVRDSYKAYKIRMIVLQKGKTPEDQLKTKIEKIEKEATSGGDFAKLVKDYSEAPDKAQGGGAEYTFDTQFGLPPGLGELLSSMAPAAVRDLDTEAAVYIVKLESVVDKTPKNLADKEMKKRRDAVQQVREMQAGMKAQTELAKGAKVTVKSPEMLGYWMLGEVQKSRTAAEAQSKMNKAVAAFKEAARRTPDNSFVQVKLAQVLAMTGKTKEALTVLYPMLEGDNATIEGADLRMLLADTLLKNKETEKAIVQYSEASEVAMSDPNVHTQLMAKFKELGRSDLVAKEQQWLKDYQIKKDAWDKANRGAPVSGGRPSGPAPSGGE